MKTTRKNVRNLVNGKVTFYLANLFARYESPTQYVVYSYGTHWPLYLFDAATGVWYGNADTYSRTTSHHANATRPTADIHWCSLSVLLGHLYPREVAA